MQLDILSARLARAFPDLADGGECLLLASGFRSLVVEMRGGLVFRIGKNKAAARGFAREARLLPTLQGWLPVAVPNPICYSPPSALFPCGVLGYRKLPGVPLAPRRLAPSVYLRVARDVAAFLVALHHVPLHAAGALGVATDPGAAAWLTSRQARVLPALRRCLPEQEYRRLEQWWRAVSADATLRNYEPVLRHGDLWYENILVDEATGEVTGVLDFEQTTLGDRAQDFATQCHLGEEFAALVLDNYRRLGGTCEADFAQRVAVWWQLREIEGVDFALQIGDGGELEDAMGKLRRGPVLGPAVS